MENEIEKELNGLYNTMKKPTVSPQIQQKGGINQSVQMQQDIQQQPKINIGIKNKNKKGCLFLEVTFFLTSLYERRDKSIQMGAFKLPRNW